MFVDYYKIAQVHPESEESVIRRMRKIFAMMYHPDTAPVSLKEEYTRKMQEINAALDILLDPVKRSEYDAMHPYFKSRCEGNNDSRERKRQRSEGGKGNYAYANYYSSDIQPYLDAEMLFEAAKKAKKKNVLTPFERKQFYNFAKRIQKNIELTEWQRKNIAKYVNMGLREGIL